MTSFKDYVLLLFRLIRLAVNMSACIYMKALQPIIAIVIHVSCPHLGLIFMIVACSL